MTQKASPAMKCVAEVRLGGGLEGGDHVDQLWDAEDVTADRRATLVGGLVVPHLEPTSHRGAPVSGAAGLASGLVCKSVVGIMPSNSLDGLTCRNDQSVANHGWGQMGPTDLTYH